MWKLEGQVVLSARNDMQICIREVTHKDPSSRNRTQWVTITPDQEDRHFDTLQLRCRIGTIRFKPIGQIRIMLPEFLAPVCCAELDHAEPPEVATKTRCVMRSLLRKAASMAITPPMDWAISAVGRSIRDTTLFTRPSKLDIDGSGGASWNPGRLRILFQPGGIFDLLQVPKTAGSRELRGRKAAERGDVEEDVE
jgi:hypothetical protein